MFSNRAEPRSIATQLVVRFTLAAALLLSCALGIFYWLVIRHAVEEDDAVLADKVETLQWNLEERGNAATFAAEITAVHSKRTVFFLRLLDAKGGIEWETPGMESMLPLAAFPNPAANETGLPQPYQIAKRLFALTTRHVILEGTIHTLQVAQDRSEDERFRREFGILFLTVLGAGVLASALIAFSVTRRGLKPLAKLTRSLERIAPGKLHERIGSRNWPHELQPVAAAYDGMLARLEDSFVRLSQFSADLAHELRTPVGNILGEAQVTLSRARSPEEYCAALESTVAECERLSLIVDNLLFLAHAEAHDRQADRTLINGRAAAEKIAAYYETPAEDRGVKIGCTGEGQILADPVLFDRALGNVVDNALRFTPKGGEIRINLSQNNGEARVAVSDTGSGIPQEALPHVFDRFFRGDPSRTSSAGTGLGLSLVRSIMELHGGSASIESKVGQGTTVTLAFPLA